MLASKDAIETVAALLAEVEAWFVTFTLPFMIAGHINATTTRNVRPSHSVRGGFASVSAWTD